MSQQTDPQPTNERVEAQYEEYLMPIWKDLNVPIKRASGCTVEDFEGNEYLDVFSGISVTNVGHNNESVVEAATAQPDEFVHACTYVHPNPPAVEPAAKPAQTSPADLQPPSCCHP